jgi:hypothetical protein
MTNHPPGVPRKFSGTEVPSVAAWASVLASEAVNNSDAAIIAQRKKIENAPRARRRCTCEHPLLFDEDGEVRCFKCARPTAAAGAPREPRGDFPAAAVGPWWRSRLGYTPWRGLE